MTLHSPFAISSRLLPSLTIAGATISLCYCKWTKDGRISYTYNIDIGDKSYTKADLNSGVGGGTLQEGFASLLTFLGTAEGFPDYINEWAKNNESEIFMVREEIERTKNLIEE